MSISGPIIGRSYRRGQERREILEPSMMPPDQTPARVRPLLVLVSLPILGFWLFAKTALLRHLDYIGDLFSFLQMSRSFAQGRPQRAPSRGRPGPRRAHPGPRGLPARAALPGRERARALARPRARHGSLARRLRRGDRLALARDPGRTAEPRRSVARRAASSLLDAGRRALARHVVPGRRAPAGGRRAGGRPLGGRARRARRGGRPPFAPSLPLPHHTDLQRQPEDL